jgi:hypothetical protein
MRQQQRKQPRRGWERFVRPETHVTDALPRPRRRCRRKHPQWVKREEKRHEVLAALDAIARRMQSERDMRPRLVKKRMGQ